MESHEQIDQSIGYLFLHSVAIKEFKEGDED
jgi:hypothetical protein